MHLQQSHQGGAQFGARHDVVHEAVLLQVFSGLEVVGEFLPQGLLNHPAAIEDILLTHHDRFVKGRGFERAKRLLGDGLLTADTTLIEQVVGTTASVALRNFVLAIGGIGYLFSIAPRLTAMLLIGIPLVLGPILFMGRRLRDMSKSSQDRIADVGVIVDEVLGAMKIVQAFGQEGREGQRFSNAVENAFGTARRRIRIRALLTAIMIFMMFGAITMVMWQGALDVQSGRMTGGSIAAFVITGGLVAGSVQWPATATTPFLQEYYGAVDLPSMPMPGPTMASGALGARGRYAFWIGDEGIKAKVNLPDANAPFPAATVTDWDKGFAGSAAQRSAIESVTPSLNATAAALLPGGFSANFQAWRANDILTAGNWNLLQLPQARTRGDLNAWAARQGGGFAAGDTMATATALSKAANRLTRLRNFSARSSVWRISAGAIQLLVGPASSSRSEQI